MVVLQRPLDLGREVERELQLLRSRALPDGLADLRIGDLGVQQDLEQLAEQHHRCVRAVGDVKLELDQRTPRLGVLDADPVVEEIDDLVGDPCCGLGAERQQRGMAKHRVAAADRLAGRVTHVLREHPPPVRRDHLQIPVFGLQRAQQLKLLDRLADPSDRPRLLAELLDRRRRRARADHKQLVKAVLQYGRQERRYAAVDLLLTIATCRDNESLEDGQTGTHQPVAPQPVDGAAQQRKRPIMPERTVRQPCPQRVQIGVSARPERADRHGLGDVLGASVALGVQARRCD